VRLDFEARGIDRTSRRVARIGRHVLNATPAFEEIADELIDAERQQFATGKGWPPLARSTRVRKLRSGTLWQGPMRDSGQLETALTASRRRRPKGRLLNVRQRGLRFGIRGGRGPLFHGVLSQRGTRRQPKRVVVPPPTSRDRRRFAKIIQRHVLENRR
jgi:hypothetical protein